MADTSWSGHHHLRGKTPKPVVVNAPVIGYVTSVVCQTTVSGSYKVRFGFRVYVHVILLEHQARVG